MQSVELLSSNRVSKPIILHIGDPIKYNFEEYQRFSTQFNVIRPTVQDRQRPAFISALKEKRWGDFSAIYRPFWNTGGEMGNWDDELIQLLPNSVQIFASAGAGYDWVNTELLAERGIACQIPMKSCCYLTNCVEVSYTAMAPAPRQKLSQTWLYFTLLPRFVT